MRLAMVQLVVINLKSFYPMAGHDLIGKDQTTVYTQPLFAWQMGCDAWL
jgi:hypothetical protein